MPTERHMLAHKLRSRLDKAMRRTGYRLVRADDPLYSIDVATAATMAAVGPFTLVSAERVCAVQDAVTYIERFGIEGAIVECGVWRGGAMMAAARRLLELGGSSRDIYLFDTYEGMTTPTALDRDWRGVSAADQMALAKRASGETFLAKSVEEVRQNLFSTGYAHSSLHFVKGPVEETVPGEAPKNIALLRLDTDWYESTRHELQHLMPRLVPNGVLIVDDYGHWQGARKAVDEFLAYTDRPVLLNRTDYSGRMAIVPQGPTTE